MINNQINTNNLSSQNQPDSRADTDAGNASTGHPEHNASASSEVRKRLMTPKQCNNSIARSERSIEKNNEKLESLYGELEAETDPAGKNNLIDRIGSILRSIETSEKNIADKTALKEQLVAAESKRREDILAQAKTRLGRE